MIFYSQANKVYFLYPHTPDTLTSLQAILNDYDTPMTSRQKSKKP